MTAGAGEFVAFDNEGNYEKDHAAEAEAIIGQAVELMSRSTALELVWSGNPQGVEGSIQALQAQLKAVRDGELRMAVVAPMKAGKSTLVNTLVGYEFLPARGEAMTTLPTRIVLDRLATEEELAAPDGLRPVMRLAGADARQLERLLEAVRKQLPESAKRITDKHPHLSGLAKRISSGELATIDTEVTGRVAVQRALHDLNDLLRLAEMLGLSSAARLTDIPVVHTLYWSPNARASEAPGRLVVIDTPGPDEAELARVLAPVVERQLRDSHIVFAILDYTKMNNEADKKVRDLMRSALAVIGQEKLYAIVNKIDQRDTATGRGLTDEQIVGSVGTILGMPKDLAGQRVFRMSAELALRSALVLGDIAGGRLREVAASESARRFLEKARPFEDLADVLEEYSDEGGAARLERLARRAWTKNGLLDEFLESAIADLRARALPLAIEAALKRTVREVDDLVTAVRARRDLIGRESSELTEAAGRLSTELRTVDKFRQTVTTPDEIADKTVAAVGKILDEAVRKGDAVVATMEGEAGGGGQRRYDSDSEARMFIQATTAGPSATIELRLGHAREQAEAEIIAAAGRYLAAESSNIEPVLERAADSLDAQFNFKFRPPDVSLTLSEAPEMAAPEHQSRSWTTTETRTRAEYRWYTLWAWPHQVTETVSVPHSSSYYTVDISVLADNLRGSLRDRVTHIHAELSGQVKQVLVSRMTEYLNEVEAYLRRYQKLLQQSAKDNQLQEQERKQLREVLDGFLAEAVALQGALREGE
jgi:hypothetical protein